MLEKLQIFAYIITPNFPKSYIFYVVYLESWFLMADYEFQESQSMTSLVDAPMKTMINVWKMLVTKEILTNCQVNTLFIQIEADLLSKFPLAAIRFI